MDCFGTILVCECPCDVPQILCSNPENVQKIIDRLIEINSWGGKMKTIYVRGTYALTAFFLVLSLTFLSNCDSTGPSYDPIEITGQVLDSDTEDPIVNGIVRLVQPTPEKTTVTDGDGRFFFEVDVDSTMDVRVQITKEGYQMITLETVAIPERNIDFPVAQLSIIRDDDDDDDDAPIDDEDPDIESGGPFSIVLSSVSSETISVKGTGDAEQAEFVFQVADSSGVPVRDAEAEFSLGSAPGGGEVVYPQFAETDSNGEIKTTLTSGTISGTVQVIATIQRDGFTVESRPVRITIQSGLPSENHFTLKDPDPAMISDNETSEIAVLLGDRHGNPVSAGTSVYFSTTGGVIDGSAKTDEGGEASVILRYGNPIPENGRAIITAQTTDENNQTIKRETEVLFSSGGVAIQVNPLTARLADLSGMTFNYTVSDDKGNPLSAGTSISVSADGMDAELSGDIDVTLGDHSQAGPGATEFSFRVLEAKKQAGIGNRDIYFVISVSGPLGEETLNIPIDYSPGGAASIAVSSISSETITVKETGGTEQSEFVFQVTDSSGMPVHQAEVEFSLGSSPGGGETIYPQTATSDVNGQVKTTLTSGTISGVVQVIASIQRDGFEVKSRPVRVAIQSGLPSNNHFTIYRSSPLNVPVDGTTGISVLLGDRYGNPVAEGTRVYFTTDYGVVGASAATNADGRAGVTLQRGEPMPPDGFVTVRAQTVDENNQSIERQATVLFHIPPIIIDVEPNTFFIDHLSDQTFNYTVTDVNGNPLPAGSTIAVTVEGEDIEVIGDVDVTLDDVMTGGQGVTEFTFNVAGTNEVAHENDRPVFIEIKATTSTDTRTVRIDGRKAKEVMD